MNRLKKNLFFSVALFSLIHLIHEKSLLAYQYSQSSSITHVNIAPGESAPELAKKMPVKLIFLSESGKIYGGVFVRIFNESGIAIFKKLCEKPWLYLDLPRGDYNIVLVDRKKIKRTVPVSVKQNQVRQKIIKIKWPISAVGY